MRVDIQFVNFPKSDLIREIVSNRIKDCFDKFSTPATSIKAFFSVDGIEHHVKIAVKASNLSACINATATDAGHAIEKVIQKLESFLRRTSSKQKQKKTLYSPSDESLETSHNGKRSPYQQENVFDRYESAYVSDFEYM
ncbi:MAG: HPF/RaiA family ribosome-associated protein [Bdellovibrionota bacterium]